MYADNINTSTLQMVVMLTKKSYSTLVSMKSRQKLSTIVVNLIQLLILSHVLLELAESITIVIMAFYEKYTTPETTGQRNKNN